MPPPTAKSVPPACWHHHTTHMEGQPVDQLSSTEVHVLPVRPPATATLAAAAGAHATRQEDNRSSSGSISSGCAGLSVGWMELLCLAAASWAPIPPMP